nr:4Fe-4S binding protein [uncultured Rhodopila sp.]
MPAVLLAPIGSVVAAPKPRRALARLGDAMARHGRTIRIVQWLVVGIYLGLLVVPVLFPLPPRAAHLWDNVTLAAQFAFWGIWWPFVLLSMVLVGRTWCGVFCPEGALTEAASRFSLGRAVPRWITWRGWPFVAFVITTVYGQMVSVYQYPAPVLLILGGSTVAAVAVGLVYGRNKRVWCRYLCPVNGVFALLSKLSPISYQVDPAAWEASRARPRPAPVNCAPLVPIRTMQGASGCHMCGRCSSYRGAIRLAPRAPGQEILNVAGTRANPWETALILFGMMGVAVGAFHWSASPWFGALNQMAAEALVDAGVLWPLEHSAPWWLLTNYPGQNDVLTLLDGAMLLAYIGATALVCGLVLSGLLAASVRVAGAWSWPRFHHLAQALIPMAGCGVFLGLSANTVTLLHAEGVSWPAAVAVARAVLLAGAALWCTWLAWRIAGRWSGGMRRIAAAAGIALAAGASAYCWVLLFWVW